jgi:hypothetical protein
MARAHGHRGLRIVFVTAVAAGLAGMILVIVISFQPGPAAQAYAPLGNNRWKALTGLGVTVGLLGTITGLITGVVRRRVDGGDAASVAQWACAAAVVYCAIVGGLASGNVKDEEATMPVPAAVTSCTPEPDNTLLKCSYRWEVAGHSYSGTADSLGFPGQRVVIDVVPADPGIFNPTPGQGTSFLTTDLLLGLTGGPVVLMLAVGWFVLEIQSSRDAKRTR